MAVHNMMEDVVKDILDQQWHYMTVSCRCGQCREDIFALALNNLKPHYVSDQLGGAYVKAEFFSEQSKATVLTAIVEAKQKVSANPKHGKLTGNEDS